MKFRGFAIPFGHEADLGDGVFERIEPGAFTQMISNGTKVQLQAVDHGDREALCTTDDKLELFENEFGLCFSCDLPDTAETYSLARTIISGPHCSVNFVQLDYDEEEVDDQLIRTVKKARIDHICVGHNVGAHGRWAMCWPVIDTLDRAPLDIQAMATRWGNGESRRTVPPQMKDRFAATVSAIARAAGQSGTPLICGLPDAYREAAYAKLNGGR